jgi:hypothetical protein
MQFISVFRLTLPCMTQVERKDIRCSVIDFGEEEIGW